jgi:hypothetical protein
MSAPAPARPRLLHRPVSEAQRESARRNGARSRGPVSERGKHHSSANARTHGLYAKLHVLAKDDIARFQQKCHAYTRAYPHQDSGQAHLVTHLAFVATRLETLAFQETALWEHHLALTPPGPHQLGQALESMADDRRCDVLSRLEDRYAALQTRLARALVRERTVEVLHSTAFPELHRILSSEHLKMSVTD